MKQRHFCTLFDQNYLLKGVAMLRSLKQNCPDAHVHVLCMDGTTQAILGRLGLDFITCISLAEVEDEALLRIKKDRGIAEYCWTLSPCLPWFVLQRDPQVDFVTYVDADLLFYSPVEPLFEEIGPRSIAISEHRFSPRLKHLEVNGRFCVQWVGFRRDAEGLACLSRWRDQCIAWCLYRLEDGKLGDQKYLDEWPDRYSSCHIIQHVGAGVAPWNYSRYRFTEDGQGNLTVDGAPLIFYHFHQFQLLENGGFDRLSSFYASECKEPELIYRAYETAVTDALHSVRNLVPSFSGGLKSVHVVRTRRWAQKYLPRKAKNVLQRFIRY